MLSILAVAAWGAAPPVVTTAYGAVEGVHEFGCDVFHGVPFAAPPVGDLRWAAPVAPQVWDATLPTKVAKPMCPQIDAVKGFSLGHEDCLYLSVYSPPQCTAATPCPTMFWIYGGAWILGNNEEFSVYNAINLALKGGIVVVAANYRVDVLGWIALEELALEANGAYGNYGLQDQTFALEWTRDNAEAFGGDPMQVTIFGESAGGFSVCQHLTMPASNGLFSRAIIQSGDCSGPWLIQDGANAQAFGDTYATMIGCAKREGAAGAKERLACLRAKSPQDVMEPYTKVSVLLYTVTFYANLAHSLTRSP
jgi:carboxylesterase type B